MVALGSSGGASRQPKRLGLLVSATNSRIHQSVSEFRILGPCRALISATQPWGLLGVIAPA